MLKTKKIEYLGVQEPKTEKEIELEILGLEHSILQAKERILGLKQALAISKLK